MAPARKGIPSSIRYDEHWAGPVYYGGVIREADQSWVLAAADIFLLPSRFEGFPMSLIEAMASECVVVATELASITTVVQEDIYGLLVKPRDSADVRAKLRSLLLGDLDSRTLDENARKTVVDRFSIEYYVRRLNEIYSEIGRKPRFAAENLG